MKNGDPIKKYRYSFQQTLYIKLPPETQTSYIFLVHQMLINRTMIYFVEYCLLI